MRLAGNPLAALSLAAAVIAAGCAPPTDRMTRVAAAATPLLAEGEADSPVAAALHAGDLVTIVRTVKPSLSWGGMLDGRPTAREGELVEVRRAGDGGGLAFRDDLGAEVDAVSAQYICRRVHGAPDCPSKLRRIHLAGPGGLGDATVGYLPCFTSACPIALLRGRRLSTMTVDGLTDVRPATIDGQPVLLASALVNHEPQWTEGFVYLLRTNDGLTQAHEIKVSEVDTRTPRNHFYEGIITVEPDQVVFKGRERWTSALHDGAVLSDVPKGQNYRLSPRK